MKFVHIDGDVVRYRAGFAAEIGFWRPVRYDSDGNITKQGERLAFKSEFNSEEWDDVLYDPEPEPIENCLHSVKLIVQDILDALNLPIQRARVHLSPPGETFRHTIAKIKPYKGTRDPSHRPFYFDNITEYLDENFPVVYATPGLEADDEMAIQHVAFGKGSCIATIDKDMDQVPGWHYNFVKKETYKVSESQGLKFFWRQMLTGDSADNIQGCPGIGPVRADKILAKEDPHQWDRVVEECYMAVYQKDWDKARAALWENAKLLWILQDYGQEPPVPEEWMP